MGVPRLTGDGGPGRFVQRCIHALPAAVDLVWGDTPVGPVGLVSRRPAAETTPAPHVRRTYRRVRAGHRQAAAQRLRMCLMFDFAVSSTAPTPPESFAPSTIFAIDIPKPAT